MRSDVSTMLTMKGTLRTDAELICILKERIAAADSMAGWAKVNGFSRSFVCDVLSGTRNMTERLAAALGFKRALLWETV